MPNSVDSRVVVMSFDNKQFESGVATSMKTLDRLKSGLNFQNATKNLGGLSNAIKAISFNGMESGLDAIRYRFSTLGIVGATVIQNLTNTAINFGKNLWNNTLGQIKTGGIARAQNIEQAKFTLQGLGVEWNKISEDIDYGVKNTAYGLDAAAKAASQLVASGVEFGDAFGETGNSPMAKALRGISGVAAMTNSSYEDIAHIFTTVAGNGRLMGEQLQQFAGRGLNVAASLQKYEKFAGKTEQEIRELVSKGKISFAEFSEAMDQAFGEQAKKANDTFSGAMSNVRAALSRIGASFASPSLVAARDIMNSLRVVINDIHAALGPAIKDFEALLNRVVPKITGALDYLHEKAPVRLTVITNNIYQAFKNSFGGIVDFIHAIQIAFRSVFPTDFLSQVYTAAKKIKDFTANFRMSSNTIAKLSEVFRGVFSIFDLFKTAITSAVRALAPFSGSVVDIFKNILDVAAGIGLWISNQVRLIKENDTLYNVFTNIISFVQSGFLKARDSVLNFISAFKDFWSSGQRLDQLKKGWEGIKAIGEIFKQLFFTILPIARSFYDLIKTTFSGVISVLSPIAVRFVDIVLSIIAQLGTWAVQLKEFINTNDRFKNAIGTIFHALNDAKQAVIDFFKSFSGKDKKEADETIDDLGETGSIAQTIGNVLSKFGEKIKDAFGKVFRTLATVLGKIKAWFTPFVEEFRKNFDGITFDSFLDAINSVLLGGVLVKIHEFVRKIKGQTAPIFSTFKLFAEGFKGWIDTIRIGVTNMSRAFSDKAKADIILKLAAAIAILAVAVMLISSIDQERLLSSVEVIIALGAALLLFTKEIGKMDFGNYKSSSNFFKVASSLILISLSMILLASAVKKLALLNPESMLVSVIAVIVLMEAMVVAADFLSRTSDTKGLSRAAISLVFLAAGIKSLSKSVERLAELDPDKLMRGLLAVIVLMAASVGVIRLLSGSKGFIAAAIGLAILAGAIKILIKSVEKLGSLDLATLEQGLIAITALLAELAAFSLIVSNFGKMGVGQGLGFIALAAALMIVASVCQKLGEMDTESLIKSLLAIGAILAEISMLTIAMGSSKHVLSSAIAMVIISAALVILGKVLRDLSGLSWEDLAKGLIALGIGLEAMTIVTMIMPKNVLAVATALLIMSAAMTIMAASLKAMGGMTWEEIAKGLLTLAGAMAIMVITGKLLSGGVVMSLMGLGAAIALIGVGAGLAGVGILAFAVALGALAASGVASIGIILKGILELSPLIVSAVSELLVALIQAIEDNSVAILKAITVIGEALIHGLEILIPKLIDLGIAIILALLKGIEANIYQITELVAQIIIQFVLALSAYLPDIIDAGITLMVSFINGMAEGIRTHGDELLAAVSNLIASIIEFALSALQKMVEMIPVVGKEWSQKLEEAKQTVRETLAPESMEEIGEGASEGLAKGIRKHSETTHQAGADIANSAKSGMDSVSGFGGHFGLTEGFAFGDMLSSEGPSQLASSSGSSLGLSAISGLTSNQDMFGMAGMAGVSSYLDPFSTTDASGAGANLSTDLFSGLEGIDLSSMSDEQLNEYLSSWSNGGEDASAAADSLNTSLVDGLSDDGSEFEKTGKGSGEKYTTGVGSPLNKAKAKSAGTSLKTSALTGADGGYQGMYNKGSDAGKGYYDGLSAWGDQVRNKAAEITNIGMDTVAKTQDSASPSKEYFKLGSYAGEGYVNGIVPFIVKAGLVAMRMAKSGMDGAKTAMGHVSNLISGDLEIDPTIRPVVDLSGVQNGIDAMNTMFDNQPVIGVRGVNTASAISSRLSSRIQNDGIDSADGSAAPTQNFNFTQNNYSPKALSRLEIYRQTKNQFAQMRGAVSQA